MDSRTLAIEAHKALLNGSGKLSYFERRGISRRVIEGAYVGFRNGAFTYPCFGRNDELLGIHCKSERRNDEGKRRQWWDGYAEQLPAKGRGKDPEKPAKVIPFGLETLKNVEAGSLVVLCCGEEDALSLRQVGYTALSQPGAGLLEPVYVREMAGYRHPNRAALVARTSEGDKCRYLRGSSKKGVQVSLLTHDERK
jgi:hypothetical protein